MQLNRTPIIDTLTGSFLVSTPRMPDPRFEEQVILICAHNNEGAMGVAVNKPNPAFSLSEILNGAHLPIPEKKLPPVYVGGPVELESAFILYQSDYQTEYRLEISPTISLSRETKVLEDIARGRGPEKFLFLLGYTGWGPGQLEQELVSDGWLTVPASDHIIFDTPDEFKWKAAAMQFGIDISTFGDYIGYA
ncbi:MAG: YqgE/AlgH family protein [Desulfoprunum sp.]|jgi:putative transcriptional regulator|nr:transcriptional regulator [Desulfobulbus sp. Tol-SR]